MNRRSFNWQLGGGIIGSAFLSNLVSAQEKLSPSAVDPDKGLKGLGGEAANGWSIVVIPDTQNYAKHGQNHKHFAAMTKWIAEHVEAWNIQAVLHEGDLVEQNDIATGGGRGGGDQNSDSQWRSVQESMSTLYGKVPTILATGNHDYGERNAENRETKFNNYFGVMDNPLVCNAQGTGIWREGCPNSFGAVTLENALYTFKAPDGRDMLVLALEWGPRKEVVQWANKVLRKTEYKDHFGILLTHAYLWDDAMHDGVRSRSGNPHKYPTGKGGNTHDGKDLWKSLVKDSPNLRIVLNGHVTGRHVAYRSDVRTDGVEVHQMLFNAQGLGVTDGIRNGGNGRIRLLTFEPGGKKLSVRTLSVLKALAGKDPWVKTKGHDFVLNL